MNELKKLPVKKKNGNYFRNKKNLRKLQKTFKLSIYEYISSNLHQVN